MSYQGIRKDRDGKVWVRYRIKGQIVEAGPYESAARALAANFGRTEPPLTSTHASPILTPAGAHSGVSVLGRPSVSVKE